MRFMKKLIAAVLTGVMVISVAGCGAKEEPVATYTSKNGNFSVDFTGSNFTEEDKGNESITLKSKKFAYGVTQLPKADLEEKGIFTFDAFSTEVSENLFPTLSPTNKSEVVVTLPNLKAAKGWMLDMTDKTGTFAFLVLGETDGAYYQFMAESLKKDYNEELFLTALGTLKEITPITRPEEVPQTYTSESGSFHIDLPGQWDMQESGAGMILTRNNAMMMIEIISKEQAAASDLVDLNSFVEFVSSNASMEQLVARADVTEVTYEPGKFLASKAFIYDTSKDDGAKQQFTYLESEKYYISFSIGTTLDGFDTIMGRYGQVIQGIVEPE